MSIFICLATWLAIWFNALSVPNRNLYVGISKIQTNVMTTRGKYI